MKVIGVIPASNDYEIGTFIDDEYTFLGYQCENSYHPDWDDVIKEKIEVIKKRKELKGKK